MGCIYRWEKGSSYLWIVHSLNLVHLSHISEIFNATYNDTWKENKKFAVQALRASGFGTRASENKVMNGVSFSLIWRTPVFFVGPLIPIWKEQGLLSPVIRHWTKKTKQASILILTVTGNFFTARKRSLGQGNIFTPVFYSVQRGFASQHASQVTWLSGIGLHRVGGGGGYPVPEIHGTLRDKVMRSTSERYTSYWNAFLLY